MNESSESQFCIKIVLKTSLTDTQLLRQPTCSWSDVMTLKVVPLVEFATPMIEPTGKETGTPTPGTPGTPGTGVTLAVTATVCSSCSTFRADASSVSLVNGSDMSGSTATLSDVWLSSISAVLASRTHYGVSARSTQRHDLSVPAITRDYNFEFTRHVSKLTTIESKLKLSFNESVLQWPYYYYFLPPLSRIFVLFAYIIDAYMNLRYRVPSLHISSARFKFYSINFEDFNWRILFLKCMYLIYHSNFHDMVK